MSCVLFLDIDGVVNIKSMIDPRLADLVRSIISVTGCDVVLSSSWRFTDSGREAVRQSVCNFLDVTPKSPDRRRGTEIKMWLDNHPEVKRYAILDDDADMWKYQWPNFFKTDSYVGLTNNLAGKIIEHLNVST